MSNLVSDAMKQATARLKLDMADYYSKTASHEQYLTEHTEEKTAVDHLSDIMGRMTNEIKVRNDEKEGITYESTDEGKTTVMKEADDRPDGARGPETNDGQDDKTVGEGPEKRTDKEAKADMKKAPKEKVASLLSPTELMDLLKNNEYVQAGFQAGLAENADRITKAASIIMQRARLQTA